MSVPFRRIEDIELIQATGAAGAIGFDRQTGILRSLVNGRTGVDLCKEIRANQLGQVGGVRIWDDLDKRWWDDLQDNGSVRDVQQNGSKLTFVKTFDGCPFSILHLIDLSGSQMRWDLEISQPQTINRGLRVCFQLPLVAGWKYFSACQNGRLNEDGETGECVFDGSSLFNYMYHVGPYYNGSETTLPLISVYDTGRDAGFQFAAPADAYIPGLHFEYSNRGGYAWGSQRKDDPALYPHLDVIHNFVGLHGTKPCRIPMEIYTGRGCYRELLGQFVTAYKPMFFPKCEKIWERVGTFFCGGINLAFENDLRKFYKAVGGKYLELHGHFQYYGKYYNQGEWESLSSYEQNLLRKHGKTGKADPNTVLAPEMLNQDTLKKGMKILKKDGISTHIYFNFTDGDRFEYSPNFKDSINLDENGNPWPSGWRFCDNIHAHPGSKAWDDFIQQAEKIMAEYPDADGFFFDCFRHYDFDFGWSDGFTMINNKPASCVNFSMSKLATEIMKRAHAKGWDSFANKPRTTTSMADVDGMLLEGDGRRSEMYYYYTTLAKPNFYMWGSGVLDVEDCLKRAVVLASFPNMPSRKDEAAMIELYSKYLPLYQHFIRRVFCFEPNPLRMDPGLEAELYTVGNDYVAGVSRPLASWKDAPPAHQKKIGFVVEKADYVSAVYIHYAGEDKPRKMPVYRSGNQIVVPLPLLAPVAVVKLVVGKEKNLKQETFDAVKDYHDSCGDPVSAFEMGSGYSE